MSADVIMSFLLVLLLLGNPQVFGAGLPCTIKRSEHYYGSGESFLYQLVADSGKLQVSVPLSAWWTSSCSTSVSLRSTSGRGRMTLWFKEAKKVL